MKKRRDKAPSTAPKEGEPIGLERIGDEDSAVTDEDDIAIELPIEQNDSNAQTP